MAKRNVLQRTYESQLKKVAKEMKNEGFKFSDKQLKKLLSNAQAYRDRNARRLAIAKISSIQFAGVKVAGITYERKLQNLKSYNRSVRAFNLTAKQYGRDLKKEVDIKKEAKKFLSAQYSDIMKTFKKIGQFSSVSSERAFKKEKWIENIHKAMKKTFPDIAEESWEYFEPLLNKVPESLIDTYVKGHTYVEHAYNKFANIPFGQLAVDLGVIRQWKDYYDTNIK